VLTDAMLLWRGDVILTRDLVVAGERTEFYSRVRRGEFTRVLRGAFVRTDTWERADADGRHLLIVAAADQLEPDCLFSHLSAAALWRLPIVGPWPDRVHVIDRQPVARHSDGRFVRQDRAVQPGLAVIDGHRATGLARTVVDVAATQQFGLAVAMADAALRCARYPVRGVPPSELTRGDLEREVAALVLRHGSARAARVVAFADGRADRPGESMSRVAMHVAKVRPPLLQVELRGRSGRLYFVDFYWPEHDHIGEFDGNAKYLDPVFLRGRAPEQALLDEKAREDDLRAAGHGMTRWGWALAVPPAGLRAHLHASGVR